MFNPLRRLQVARAVTGIEQLQTGFATGRRGLIIGAIPVLAVMVTGLSGCTTAQTQAIVTDVQNAATALMNQLQNLLSLAGLPATLASQINGYIGQFKTFLAGVGQTLTDTTTSTLQKVLSLILQVLGTLATAGSAVLKLLPFPLLGQIIPALSIVIPIVAAALGISVSIPTFPAPATAGAVAPLSPAQASAVLAYFAIVK